MMEWAIFLLFIGIASLIIEMLIPGFGFFGIVGILSTAISFYITVVYVPMGIIVVLIELGIIFIVFLILYHYLKNREDPPAIVLTDKLHQEKRKRLDKDILIGKKAKTKTSLRPQGYIEIEGETLEVFSDEFLPSKTEVIIVKIDSNDKIYVKPTNELEEEGR